MNSERILTKSIFINTTIDDVWDAWTTEDGLKYISAKSNIELKRGGRYEWFLELDADEKGKRGGEGSRVLAYLPKQMIAFSWTFPPSIPELRDNDETTQVIVRFTEQLDDSILIQLLMSDWQEGEAWDVGWNYFDKAWDMVLNKLKKHLEG